MTSIALCLAQEHDLKLVVLAVIVCLAGACTIAHLFDQISRAAGRGRAFWVLLAGVATGATVWCTHFVAMMGYRTAAAVTVDPMFTVTSLVVVILVATPGIAIASMSRGAAVAGGAMVGGAVAAMHYIGMLAYQADGVVIWDRGMVAASVALSTVLGAVSLPLMRTRHWGRQRVAAVSLFCLGVASLHFTGMAALTVVPAPGGVGGLSSASMTVIAFSTAVAGLLVIGSAGVSAAIGGHVHAESMRQLERLVHYDLLTGLPNRTLFQRRLAAELGRVGAGGRLAVIKFNLCRFRVVNDIQGTRMGDQILGATGRRLGAMLQDNEFVARRGSDEFGAMKRFNGDDELRAFLLRIERTLACSGEEAGHHVPLQARFGVAVSPANGQDADTLLVRAELAMSRAREERSTLPCFYGPELDDAIRDKRDLAEQLRQAIGTDQFELHYQVKACLRTGGISGYEALLRWRHPVRGAVPPSVFIPLAEEMGEIVRISDWVLLQACHEAASWPGSHKVAVNLSPIQLSDPALVEKVRAALHRTGLDPSRLELELTESAIIKDREHALSVLGALQAMGVLIALDDFGTGFSSLDVLRCFSFDRIKLDRSFMAEIETSREAKAILRAVTTLGRWLRVPVLAEGIETASQLSIVEREGCSDVQGYLLGRPMRHPLTAAELRRVENAVLAVHQACSPAF